MEREGDMGMRERGREGEEGQKRCIISRAPPSPFTPVEWWGQPDPHLLPSLPPSLQKKKKKSFVKVSPAERRRGRVSAEQRRGEETRGSQDPI